MKWETLLILAKTSAERAVIRRKIRRKNRSLRRKAQRADRLHAASLANSAFKGILPHVCGLCGSSYETGACQCCTEGIQNRMDFSGYQYGYAKHTDFLIDLAKKMNIEMNMFDP